METAIPVSDETELENNLVYIQSLLDLAGLTNAVISKVIPADPGVRFIPLSGILLEQANGPAETAGPFAFRGVASPASGYALLLPADFNCHRTR